MFKTSVFLIATLTLVMAFQNCGNTVPTGAGSPTLGLSDSSSYETPLVNVRAVAKTDASEPTRIILDGYFRDGCPATVEPVVESSGSVHKVRAVVTTQNSKDVSCTMALEPFEAPVTLSGLESGRHTVSFETEDGPRELVLDIP